MGKIRTCFLLTALISIIPVSLHAETTEIEKNKALASQFATCAAFYWATRDSNKSTDEDIAVQFGNVGNGASLAGTFIASTFLNDPANAQPYIKGKIETETPYFMTLLKDFGNPKSVAEWKNQASRCASLLPMQEKIIQTLRDNMYGVKER